MTWFSYVLVPWAAVVAVLVSAFCLLFALPTILVPRGNRERYCFWTNRLASWVILRLGLFARPHLQGSENLPVGQPYLLISNHRSFVDVLLLIWAGHTQGISKSQVFWFPVMGLLGYLGGAVFFNRMDPQDRRRAKDEALMLIKYSRALHVYPEGTRARSRSQTTQEKVYTGLVRAAFDAGIPVVPAAVWGTDTVIPATNRGIRFGQRVYAQFGAPIAPQDYTGFEAFFQAAWGQTTERVQKLKEAHPHPQVDLLE